MPFWEQKVSLGQVFQLIFPQGFAWFGLEVGRLGQLIANRSKNYHLSISCRSETFFKKKDYTFKIDVYNLLPSTTASFSSCLSSRSAGIWYSNLSSPIKKEWPTVSWNSPTTNSIKLNVAIFVVLKKGEVSRLKFTWKY